MRPLRAVGFLMAAFAAAGSLAPEALAGGHQQARRQRERVRQQRAQLAAQLDVMRAEDGRVREALEAMAANVAGQDAQLADARRAVAAADQYLDATKVAQARVAGEQARLRAAAEALAVQAYVGGGVVAAAPSVLAAGDFNEAARGRVLSEILFGNAATLRERLNAAGEDLAVARRQGEAAAAAAATRRADADRRARAARHARDQQAEFAAALERRIEGRLAEAASLAQLDQQLSAEIVRRQEALARRDRGAPGRVAAAPGVAAVPLRSARGIWVHASLADRLEALLSAAEAGGVVLGGAGYRDPAQQQRLREAHCPDPAGSPASSCRPPTARPGHSMHERGLAVDFTWQGRIIASRSSPAFRWLAANASRFGLHNLPGEPWHWSTNGN